METAAQPYGRSLQNYATLICSHRRLRFGSLSNTKAGNVRSAATLARRAGGYDLNLRCFSWNIGFNNNQIHFQDRRPFFAQPVMKAGRIADRTETSKVEAQLIGSILGDEKKKVLKEIPPPPEKPLPGDCCGSGCIRCVWDVYYEELEEYNKLYKGDLNPKPYVLVEFLIACSYSAMIELL